MSQKFNVKKPIRTLHIWNLKFRLCLCFLYRCSILCSVFIFYFFVIKIRFGHQCHAAGFFVFYTISHFYVLYSHLHSSTRLVSRLFLFFFFFFNSFSGFNGVVVVVVGLFFSIVCFFGVKKVFLYVIIFFIIT